jgi:hypothetical protein
MRGEHRRSRGDRATPTSQLASRQPLTRGDPGGARRGASCGAPTAGGVHLAGCSTLSAALIHRKIFCQGNRVQLGGESRNAAAHDLPDRFVLQPEIGMGQDVS